VAVARFEGVCLDTVDPARLGRFWAGVLDAGYEPRGDGGLVRRASRPILRVYQASGPKTVKHRVHLDIYAATIAEVVERGSRVVLPEGGDRRWTVMADPEDGEYCAFLRDDPPADRLHGLVVDCADPRAQAQWWARVLDVEAVEQPTWFSIERVPGMPFSMDFVPVPEPKTAENRVYWDVTVPDLAPLVGLGATVRRPHDANIDWHAMTDPEGNEFRAFEAVESDR
jgi:hypothetical protein